MGSSPIRKRVMSRSCTAMSLKIPPPPLTYSNGGGAGSREHSLTVIVLPTSPAMIACFTRAKLGSKRRCSAVISLTPAFSQHLIASIVSGRSVAMGFSQNTCLPALAHALICCAWKLDGEQIQTASTSGWLITSMSSAVKCGTLNADAAFCALDTVGLEMMIGRASGHALRASRCTRPMRPAPITPTPSSLMAIVAARGRAGRATCAPGATAACPTTAAAAAPTRRTTDIGQVSASRTGRVAPPSGPPPNCS